MITQADIEANRPMVLKWAKPLTSSGAVTDGVMAGQANEFLTRIDEEAEFLSLVRYIEMDGETQDIQQLRVKANLMNMNQLAGGSVPGAQVDKITSLTETTPSILKQTLVAQPFTAYTIIPKTFLKTNIEKEGFLAKYEALLAPSVAYSAEQIAIFGKNTGADAKGIHALKGILAQLDDVKTAWGTGHGANPKMPMGEFTTIDASSTATATIAEQLDAMIRQFTYQKGKRANAVILVSSELQALLISELGNRETAKGDDLVFNDQGNLMFRGIAVKQIDALDDPVNSYGDVCIICDPNSIGYGPVMEAESEAEYSVERKAYLTSIDVMFDVAVIFAEDVLYADVNYTPSA